MSKSDQSRAESIRQRLRNLMRERGEDVQFALQRYAIERFLYRLGISRHRDRFVLKGATLFALWGGSVYRPTRDLDFTGYGSSDETDVLNALRDICRHPGQTDELAFDADTLTAEQIRDDSEYQGLRIRFEARLGESRIPVQIDIGFGNAIEPPPQEAEYPTFLNDPPPRIRTYPPEAVVAEKLHAMVVLGERNSRYKDFYDLYVLARQFPFPGERLVRAVAATFARRRTPIDAAIPIALTPRFYADDDRAARWRTYLTRNTLPGAPADFDAVGEQILAFIGPLWSALAEHAAFTSQWQPGGPWAVEKAQGRPAAQVQTVSGPGKSRRLIAGTPRVGAVSPGTTQPLRSGLGRFRSYPEYKNSGAEWLVEIPGHWEVKRLKFIALEPLAYGANESAEVDDPDLPRFIRITDIKDDGSLRDDTFRSLPEDVALPFLLEYGDVLFARSGATIGKTFMYRESWGRACHAGYLIRCRINPAVAIPEFLSYFAASSIYWGWLSSVFIQATIQNVSAEKYANLVLPTLPLAEQRLIVEFLNLETAKIDALVAKNEQLIELLQEKRTALTTQAVTKGLDPNAPMKDSGVEWLGEIPAHWMGLPLKRWVAKKITDGPHETPEFLIDGVEFISAEAVSNGRIDFDKRRGFISPELHAYYCRKCKPVRDDILMCKSGATTGKLARVEVDYEFSVWSPLAVMRSNRFRILPRFLQMALGSEYVQKQVKRTWSAGTQPNISMSDLEMLFVVAPSTEEQEKILDYLNRETGGFDALCARVHDAIARLKEYRTALISAAVTGKIDVRGEVA